MKGWASASSAGLTGRRGDTRIRFNRARVYVRALAGGRRTYEEVAADFGVTRAAVCQYLAIVRRRLPADVIAAAEGEGEPSRLRSLSMKRLVGIARLSTDEARREAVASPFARVAANR